MEVKRGIGAIDATPEPCKGLGEADGSFEVESEDDGAWCLSMVRRLTVDANVEDHIDT